MRTSERFDAARQHAEHRLTDADRRTAFRSVQSLLNALLTVAVLASPVAAASPAVASRAARTESPPTLKRMLKIRWTRGPNLPQGFQDSDGGVIGSTLITVCGFCSGRAIPAKPDAYPRGFLKKAWGLDLAQRQAGWRRLPDFPGAARQENFAIVVGNVLYCWGGFSYSPPYCYKDGYQLSRHDGTWTWRPLPPLPWPICSSGIAAIGTKIYVCAGADYNRKRFYTETDRTGGNKRLGAHLLVIDTNNLPGGWEQLPDCPGTPRWVPAMAAVRGKIYLIGGATGDLTRSGKKLGYCTVVDNWVYDPPARRWSRIRDLPISSGNFPSGAIAWRDRYVLLFGGHQYAHVANPDGTIRAKYGHAGRFQNKGAYHNDVFVYDVQTDQFGRADSLPINNNLPMAVVHGDEAFLIGGETGGGIVEGEPYGHHPDLLLLGKIELPTTP